jgi:hypothetical protein
MPLSQIKTNSIAAGNITSPLIASVANTAIVGRISSTQQPAGAVLQFKHYSVSGGLISGHGTNYQDVWTTGTVSGGQFPNITPISTSSTVYITWWHQPLIDGDDAQLNIKLYKTLTAGSNWSELAVSGGYYFGNNTDTNFQRQHASLSASYGFVPGSTSTQYFTMTMNCNNSSRPFYYHIGDSSMSRITIMEIAA